jgi:hypothetical protein
MADRLHSEGGWLFSIMMKTPVVDAFGVNQWANCVSSSRHGEYLFKTAVRDASSIIDK